VVRGDVRLGRDPIFNVGEMAQSLLMSQCDGPIFGRQVSGSRVDRIGTLAIFGGSRRFLDHRGLLKNFASLKTIPKNGKFLSET
jgi:hypothetical protein